MFVGVVESSAAEEEDEEGGGDGEATTVLVQLPLLKMTIYFLLNFLELNKQFLTILVSNRPN